MLERASPSFELRVLLDESGRVLDALNIAFDASGKVTKVTNPLGNPIDPQEDDGKICYRLANGQYY